MRDVWHEIWFSNVKKMPGEMKRCCASSAGCSGEGKYKDVVLDIKASEQTSEADMYTHTHTKAQTHTHTHTPFDFISGVRPVIYMQNPQSPDSPC